MIQLLTGAAGGVVVPTETILASAGPWGEFLAGGGAGVVVNGTICHAGARGSSSDVVWNFQ